LQGGIDRSDKAILGNIQGLEFVDLSERDVVRHPLVQKVIEAYQKKATL